MEYEVVKKWLDELVADFKASTQKRILSPSIYASINGGMWVLIYDGIDIIADVMGLKLKEELMTTDLRVWFVYYFHYNGVKFVQYGSKRLAGYGDT